MLWLSTDHIAANHAASVAKANPYDQELGLKDEPSKPRTPLQLSLFEKPDTLPEGAHATVEANSKPGDTSPGPTMPGDTSPGSTKPGDTSPGPTMPGDTSPGPKSQETLLLVQQSQGTLLLVQKSQGTLHLPGSITANHRASPGLITEGDSPLSAGHTDLLKPLEGSSTSLSALKRLWKNSWKKHSRDETSSDSASKRNKLPLKMRLKLSAYKRSASKEERPDPTLSMLESEERSHAVEQEEDMPAYRLGGHQGSRRREGEKDNKKKKKKQMLTQGKDIHSVGQEKVEEEKMEKEEEEVMKGSMVQTTSPVSETATFMEQHLHTVQTDQRYSTSSPSDRSGDKEATPSTDTESPYDKMFAITSVVKLQHVEKDSSSDDPTVDQGPDNLQELTNIFREVLSEGCSKEAVEPHPNVSKTVEPHPNVSKAVEPHPNVSKTVEPHPNVSKTVEPHPNVSKTVEPHPNVSKTVEPHPNVSKAVEPHPNVSKAVEPHPNVSKTVEPHPNVSKTVEPHPNVSKQNEDGDDPMQGRLSTRQPGKPDNGGEVVINGNVSHMLRVFRGEDKPGEEVKQRKAIAESNDEEEEGGGGRIQGAEPGDNKPQLGSVAATKRGSDGSPFYMTPANLPHLSKLLEDHQRRMVAMAQEAVDRLTKEPMSSQHAPQGDVMGQYHI
eukprot:Em0343g3a